MATVTLIFADGQVDVRKIDFYGDDAPLTVNIPRSSAFKVNMAMLASGICPREVLEDFVSDSIPLTAEELDQRHCERWHTFELVDRETLRYQERV